MFKKQIIFLFFFYIFTSAYAQIDLGKNTVLSGSLQTENLIERTENANHSLNVMDNTYLDLSLISKYISAGARLEYLQYPLPGYEEEFGGYGLGNLFITGKYENIELTAGSIFDQFGSGLIFRTYEERSMGIDNSLMGGRIKYQPYKGINLKVLGGKQRRYFNYNKSYVWGADAEFSIDQWSKKLQEKNTYWSWGISFVSKHEGDEDISFYNAESGWFKRLNLPQNVGAFDVRTKLQKGNVTVLAEYALKVNDPSVDNGYFYHQGNAALLSASYSQKGATALIQVKRSDNMSFRSKRSVQGVSSFINHLPAFTQQHTYALPAIYPYATRPDGEWAFQSEFSYNFKRKTALGGKYGTTVRLNASHIRAIDTKYIPESGHKGKDEYTSAFFKSGKKTYYQDINIDIDKKISNSFKMNVMYMNQRYNPEVIVQHNEDIITSNIFVWEGKYNINKKATLRAEAQYLHASKYTGDPDLAVQDRSNQGDWIFGLLELSLAPSWMFAVQDMYNTGVTKTHYYMLSTVYTYKSHRIQLGYGKTRAGYDCSGGVCRFVPETWGLRLNYNFQF
jgi:hypothetical protein